MNDLPTNVSVKYTVNDELFARTGLDKPEDPLTVNLNFTASAPVQSPANNPLLASLNASFAKRLQNLFEKLFPHQELVMEYLRESPENAKKFTENPLQVLINIADIPESLQEEIKAIQKQFPNAVGSTDRYYGEISK